MAQDIRDVGAAGLEDRRVEESEKVVVHLEKELGCKHGVDTHIHELHSRIHEVGPGRASLNHNPISREKTVGSSAELRTADHEACRPAEHRHVVENAVEPLCLVVGRVVVSGGDEQGRAIRTPVLAVCQLETGEERAYRNALQGQRVEFLLAEGEVKRGIELYAAEVAVAREADVEHVQVVASDRPIQIRMSRDLSVETAGKEILDHEIAR